MGFFLHLFLPTHTNRPTDPHLRSQGAILEEPPADDDVSSLKFAGSTIVVVAESRQAVMDLLKDDVYVEAGVWDLDKVRETLPFPMVCSFSRPHGAKLIKLL